MTAAARSARQLPRWRHTDGAGGPGPEEMGSSTFRALAWSEADDIPDVAPDRSVRLCRVSAETDAMGGPRPQMQFAEPETERTRPPRRRPFGLIIAV